MSVVTLVTHFIALMVGFGVGWWGYSKYGSKVSAIEADIKQMKS